MRILGVFLIVPVLYIESAKLTVYYKAIQYKKKIEFLIPENINDFLISINIRSKNDYFMISKKDFFLTEYDASFLIFSKECDSESNSPGYSVHDLLNAPPPKKNKK